MCAGAGENFEAMGKAELGLNSGRDEGEDAESNVLKLSGPEGAALGSDADVWPLPTPALGSHQAPKMDTQRCTQHLEC